MDSNLINIDDLVRQRLSGAEERERSGAWLRMQDLLEQENKKKPLGFIYWRRTIAYVGVMLLLASMTLGGYEAANGFRDLGCITGTGNSNIAQATTSGANNPGTVATATNADATSPAGVQQNDALPNGQPAASANGTKPNDPVANSATTTTTATANHGHPSKIASATPISKQSTVAVAQQSAPAELTNNSQTNSAAPSNNNSIKSKAIAATTTAAATKPGKHGTASNVNTTAVDNNTTTDEPMSNLVASSTTIAKNTGSTHSATRKHSKTPTTTDMSQLPLAGAVSTQSAGNSNANNTPTTLASATNTVKKSLNANSSSVRAKKMHTSASSAHNNNSKTISRTAVASSSIAHHATNRTSKGKHKGGNNGPGIAATSTKHNNSSATGQAGKNSQPVAVVNAQPAKDVSTNSAATATTVVKDEKAVASINKPATETKKVENIKINATRTGKYPGRSRIQMDTISIDEETVTVEKQQASNAAEAETPAENVYSGSAASNQQVSALPGTTGSNTGGAGTAMKPAKKSAARTAGTGATSTTGNANASNNSGSTASATAGASSSAATAPAAPAMPAKNTTNAAPATTDSLTLAAAAPAAASTPAADKKAEIAAKKKESHFWESLSNKFNDLKVNLSSMHCAPGLTAGINSTFFGPNSFKGFQFGVTAAFEVDEKWSFFTELKYFQRMNNDYSMQTSYVQYDAVPPSQGSGYYRHTYDETFSFSTLHSFELPLSLRYTVGKCNFYGGGNILYTFAVNTGAEPQIDPTQTVKVSTPGTNTAPTLNAPDFGARFGLGYLFGFSYKIAPNLMLDFRNVQTVWDNQKSAGARTVSGQLYNSPSLQFSIQYRLGSSGSKN